MTGHDRGPSRGGQQPRGSIRVATGGHYPGPPALSFPQNRAACSRLTGGPWVRQNPGGRGGRSSSGTSHENGDLGGRRCPVARPLLFPVLLPHDECSSRGTSAATFREAVCTMTRPACFVETTSSFLRGGVRGTPTPGAPTTPGRGSLLSPRPTSGSTAVSCRGLAHSKHGSMTRRARHRTRGV